MTVYVNAKVVSQGRRILVAWLTLWQCGCQLRVAAELLNTMLDLRALAGTEWSSYMRQHATGNMPNLLFRVVEMLSHLSANGGLH